MRLAARGLTIRTQWRGGLIRQNEANGTTGGVTLLKSEATLFRPMMAPLPSDITYNTARQRFGVALHTSH